MYHDIFIKLFIFLENFEYLINLNVEFKNENICNAVNKKSIACINYSD